MRTAASSCCPPTTGRPRRRRNHAFYRQMGFLSYEEKQMAGFGLPRIRPPKGQGDM